MVRYARSVTGRRARRRARLAPILCSGRRHDRTPTWMKYEMSERDASYPDRVERARQHIGPPGLFPYLGRLQKAFCEPARVMIAQALRSGPLSVNELARVIGRAP